MSASSPAISVLMPCFNAARYLDSALRSVRAQSFADFELLLLDDGSTDESRIISESHARNDNRIRILGGSHRGLVAQLNTGIESARAPLLARMDCDDVCLPDRFVEQVHFLDCYPQHVAVGCWLQEIDAFGSPMRRIEHPLDHDVIDGAFIAGRSGAIAHPTVMMRADAVRRVGGYREGTFPAEDLDLFLRLGEVGRLGNVPQVLFQYRQHGSNVCFQKQQRQREQVDRVLAEARRRRGLTVVPGAAPPAVHAGELTAGARLRSWALHAIAAGNLGVARKHALGLLRAAPLKLESWKVMYWALTG